MEGQTKVLWDFLETAYRTGAIDEFLELSKAATDKKYENQALVFAELEDAVSEMEDFSGVDETIEEAFRQIPALTDEETLEGLRVIVSFLTPLVDSVMESVDRDGELLGEKRDKLIEDLPKAAKALLTILAQNSCAILSAMGDKPARDLGENMGRGLNAMASIINGVHERDPNAVSDFMAGAFGAVDGDAVSRMADTLTNALLDQKPPVLRWTAATMAKRAGKRVLNK